MTSFIKNFFLNVLPIFIVNIKGFSMEPFLKNNDKILAVKKYIFLIKINDVVILKLKDKFMIKRVKKIVGKKYFLMGDNKNESIDSREFGLVDKKNILGKMIFKI